MAEREYVFCIPQKRKCSHFRVKVLNCKEAAFEVVFLKCFGCFFFFFFFQQVGSNELKGHSDGNNQNRAQTAVER